MSQPPGEIRALDDRTIREIAAGEVVERPASVVKELLENALDAGADRIAVAVENGGIDHIRVRDTGHGIPAEQLPTAVGEHTTSKLTGGLSAVSSLGFRGEALYSIGAVSRLEIQSRPTGQDAGRAITVDHGDHSSVQRVGCPTGTTVEVTELFAETPARRKFLAEPTTEFDHVNRVVSAYALANPSVAVSLEHDNREVFASPGDGTLRGAALAVYGSDVARSLVDVGDEAVIGGDSAVETGVGGVVSDPEITRASRAYVTVFVNGRWVQDAQLRSAVVDAYGGQLAADRYPFAVVFVAAPPETVDANVHPRKTEVRFDDDDVYDTVRNAVRSGLLSAGLLRGSAPRGASAPDETQLDQQVVGGAGTDHERAAERAKSVRQDSDSGDSGEVSGGSDGEPGDSGGESGDLGRESDESDGNQPAADESGGTDAVLEAWADVDTESTDDPSSENQASSDSTGKSDSDSTGTSDGNPTGEADDRTTSEPGSGERPTPHGASRRTGEQTPSPRDWQTSGESATVPTQATLAGGTATGPETQQLPSLRVLGQYDDTYLVCASPEGLVLVDQHAADERVNYERLREAVGGDAQALVEPVEIELTAREAALFDRLSDALERVGFDAHETADRTLAVTAVPAVFDATLDPSLLRDALTAAAERMGGDDPVGDTVDALLADLACYPSITGHTSLTEGTATALLSALDGCENPYACPHGRPVVVQIGGDEIDERFERDYPGHE